jgi:hypothetical protein
MNLTNTNTNTSGNWPNPMITKSVYWDGKVEKRIDSIIGRYWSRKGYWKQRLAMKLSYEVGSLEKAWKLINDNINARQAVIDEKNRNYKPYTPSKEIDLTYLYGNGKYYEGD